MSEATMPVARLHGAKDLRLTQEPLPSALKRGEVRLRVGAVGICGSDLHTYEDGQIGGIQLQTPLVLGHEFGGTIEAIDKSVVDGMGQTLTVGTRVAVDPAVPCGRCEHCLRGHPNLCPNVEFCGTWPHDGAMRTWMNVPEHTCFPIPDTIDDAEAGLLETLGVAIHAVDLAHVKVGDTVAVLGAGPIGLCILQVLLAAGASKVYVSDRLPWRLKLVEQLGGVPVNFDQVDSAQQVHQWTNGRGVDVAIEAAWSDHSVQQAVEMTRIGGRLVIVGISSNDMIQYNHAMSRRKGLTIAMCRRMKFVYPRAIALVTSGRVDLRSLVSHRMPLSEVNRAFEMNVAYEQDVVKIALHL